MKLHVALTKAAFLFCTSCFFAVSCSKKSSDLPDGSGGSGDGSDDDLSLTIPVAHTGNVPGNPDPNPTPQVKPEYAPFVGVWKQKYGDYIYAFLPDGRVALQTVKDGKTLGNVGMYFKSNTENWFDFVWKFTDPERLSMSFSNDMLSIMIFDYTRVGGAEEAQETYDQFYNHMKDYAESVSVQFPVGHVTNTTPNKYDPKPGNVVKGANVFTTGIHFEASFTSTKWYDMPDGTIDGFDGYSRTDVWLMPNGRFFMQLWLWDGVNPQNKMESFTHQMSWGKYTVIKGSNVVDGDVINFKYDTGETAAYRTVGGQSCFLTNSVVYHQK